MPSLSTPPQTATTVYRSCSKDLSPKRRCLHPATWQRPRSIAGPVQDEVMRARRPSVAPSQAYLETEGEADVAALFAPGA